MKNNRKEKQSDRQDTSQKKNIFKYAGKEIYKQTDKIEQTNGPCKHIENKSKAKNRSKIKIKITT